MKDITKARLWGLFYFAIVIVMLLTKFEMENILYLVILTGFSVLLGAQANELGSILNEQMKQGDNDEVKRLLSEMDKRNKRVKRGKSAKGKTKRS